MTDKTVQRLPLLLNTFSIKYIDLPSTGHKQGLSSKFLPLTDPSPCLLPLCDNGYSYADLKPQDLHRSLLRETSSNEVLNYKTH